MVSLPDGRAFFSRQTKDRTGTQQELGLSNSQSNKMTRIAKPKLMHGSQEMTIRLQKILLPTDFSDYSTAATKYACELAAKFDAELHLLHTLEIHLTSTPAFTMGLALPKYVSESRAAAEKSLAGVLDPKGVEGRKVVHAIVEGSPKVEIIKYARERNIDLIVIATHGRTGLPHILMGSVAETVVRTAPCPVLTMRPEGHQFVMP